MILSSMVFPVMILWIHAEYLEREGSPPLATEKSLRSLRWIAELAADQITSLEDDTIIQDSIDQLNRAGLFEMFIVKGGRTYASSNAVWRDVFRDPNMTSPRDPLVASAQSDDGTVEVFLAVPRQQQETPSKNTARFTGAVIVVVLSAVVSFLILRDLMEPIDELRKVTSRLADGDFTVRANERILARSTEVGDLGESFNWMAESIEDFVSAQTRLLADISHELRSPLQRMDVAISLARAAPDKQGEHLDRVELEIGRINEMITGLLQITSERPECMASELCMIDAIIEDIADDAEFGGSAEGKRVLTRTVPISTNGSSVMLRRAFCCVVDNAVRYTKPGTDVEIDAGLSQDGTSAVIRISDSGPGVPPDELDKIFRPYYRTDSARHRAKGGTGLGLAIAKRIIDASGGTISASNIDRGGLLITISLPIRV